MARAFEWGGGVPAWEMPAPKQSSSSELHLSDVRVAKPASQLPPPGHYEGIWHGCQVRWQVGAKRYQATAPEMRSSPTVCVVVVKEGQPVRVQGSA